MMHFYSSLAEAGHMATSNFKRGRKEQVFQVSGKRGKTEEFSHSPED